MGDAARGGAALAQHGARRLELAIERLLDLDDLERDADLLGDPGRRAARRLAREARGHVEGEEVTLHILAQLRH